MKGKKNFKNKIKCREFEDELLGELDFEFVSGELVFLFEVMFCI